MPITLLDRLGYDFYSRPDGVPIFPPDEFDVRLVTNLERLPGSIDDALTSVVGINRLDQSALRDAARFQSAFGGVKSQRIVAITERLLMPAAELREELGMPGARRDEVLPFRDKVVMKDLLARHGIRVPEFAPYTPVDAAAALAKFGRVIVKPRREAGSMNIHDVNQPSALREFEAEFGARTVDFEVEEHIDGLQYHIDSVVTESRVISATAGNTMDPTTAFTSASPFRDIEVPPGQLFDRLLDFNQRVVSCFSNFSGVTHHEVFVTPDEIVFCEIAARLGGGGIRAGFLARTGIDLVEAMIAAQVGKPMPSPATLADTISGYALVYAPDAIMRSPVDLPYEWVLDKQLNVAVGGRAQRPRAWEHAAAIVTVSGANETEVAQRLAVVQREVTEAFDV